MKTRGPLVAAATIAVALAGAAGYAPAQPRTNPTSAPSTVPAVGVPRSDEPRSLDVDPPAPEKSPVPKAAEWARAERVRLTRVGPAARQCVATRVREWLRVRCPVKTFAVSLLGGSSEGVSFWIGPESEQQPGEVQLPLRRGDRRVVTFWTHGKDADGSFLPKPAFVLQEQWVEGEAAPTVTAL